MRIPGSGAIVGLLMLVWPAGRGAAAEAGDSPVPAPSPAAAERHVDPVDATATLGAGYDTALGPSASFTLLVGRLSTGMLGPAGQGGVARGEIGARGGKLSLGWGRMVVVVPPAPLAGGQSFRVSLMTADSRAYAGAEADVVLVARLSLGVFKELRRGGSVRLTGSIGIGF